MGGDPPEQGFFGVAQLQRRVGGMGRLQPQAPLVAAEALEGEGPLQHGHHDAAGPRIEAAVDDQQVAVVDAGAGHGVAANPQKEGAVGVADQVVIEVDAGFDVVVGGAGKAGGDAVASQGQQAPGPLQPQGPEAGQL